MFIFIYDTMMSGLKDNNEIKHCSFVEKGITKDIFYMTNLTCQSYPIISTEKIFEDQTPFNIKGEIYEIDEKTLKRLDELHSHPNYKTRHKIDVILESTDKFELTVEAYCYIVSLPDVMKDLNQFFKYTSKSIFNGDYRI